MNWWEIPDLPWAEYMSMYCEAFCPGQRMLSEDDFNG